MFADRTCYDCRSYNVCLLKQALQDVVHQHAWMLEADKHSEYVAGFTKKVAAVCKHYIPPTEVTP